MKIGIDLSQMAFQGTGVANYTKNLVENLLRIDQKNEYVLFFTSMRREMPPFKIPKTAKVKFKKYKIPPTLLEFLWNRIHFLPLEWLVGRVDVFLASDWTHPFGLKAKKVTTLHDLIPWQYPETLPPKIVAAHQRKMKWVRKECDLILCDSQATKRDAGKILKIPEKKLKVVYLGGVC